MNHPAQPSGRTSSGADEEETIHPLPYRWVILSLLWLLYAAFGLIQRAIAPVVTPILQDLNLSYTEMGFILGSWQLTYIGAAAFSGSLIDRWGVRKSLFVGALTLGFSMALRAFAKGFWTLLGAVALSGVGGPMISVGAPKAISLWFEGRSRGTAVGVYLTGAWIGGIVALTLTNSLMMPWTGNSWRKTFLLYGLLTLGVSLIWLLLARDRSPETSSKVPGTFALFGRLMKVRNVQLVMALGLLTFAILHALTQWLPKILEAGGLSPTWAGAAASLPLVAGIPALVVVPRFVSSRFRTPFLGVSVLIAFLMLILIMTGSGGLQLVALLLFGFIIAPFVPLLTLILMDTPEVGSAYMGSAGGMFYCVSEIGGFAGPLIMGVVVDLSGSFLAGTFFFAFLCFAFFVLTLLMKTERR